MALGVLGGACSTVGCWGKRQTGCSVFGAGTSAGGHARCVRVLVCVQGAQLHGGWLVLQPLHRGKLPALRIWRSLAQRMQRCGAVQQREVRLQAPWLCNQPYQRGGDVLLQYCSYSTAPTVLLLKYCSYSTAPTVLLLQYCS
jgi:hypothetical protein